MPEQEPGEAESQEGSSVGARAMHVLDRFWKVFSNAISGVSEHRDTQLAASMAYYALLSVFPAAIVLAAAVGLIINDGAARADVVDYLFRNLPLSETQGRSDVENLLQGVIDNSSTLGVIGVVSLLVTASALVSAARNSLNLIFEEDVRRGYVRGKGLDVLLVVSLGLLFVLSFAASIAGRFNIDLEGGFGGFVENVVDVTSASAVPVVLTVGLFTLAFKVLPAEHRKLRDVWPGIVFASLGYEALKRAFAVYLDNFANYSAVYGSLGAVIAFMVFVYLAAFVFLLGAEMAAVWPGVRAGDYDGDPDEEGESVLESIRGWLKGLFLRNPVDR